MLKNAVFVGGIILTFAGIVESANRELRPETERAWERYVAATEERIQSELEDGERFLAQEFLPHRLRARARRAHEDGKIYTTKLVTRASDGKQLKVPRALVHHWLGSVFIPGARIEALLRWLKDYDSHDRYFAEVERSELMSRSGDEYRIFLRLRRKKIVTVHYNTEHFVRYRRHARGRVSSASYASRIAELKNAGAPDELELQSGDDRGFLWRLHSYWRFEAVAGGVVVELETVSLSRGVPRVFRWIVGRYLDSVPRESIQSTLAPIRREVGARAP